MDRKECLYDSPQDYTVSHSEKYLAGSIHRKKFTAQKEGPQDITPATYVKLGFLHSVPFPGRTYSKA